MQSLKKTDNANRPAKLTILNTGKYIVQEGGVKALFRGVLPRLGLGVYRVSDDDFPWQFPMLTG